MSQTLFTPIQLGKIALRNRVVMAPMTRDRAGPDDAQAYRARRPFHPQRFHDFVAREWDNGRLLRSKPNNPDKRPSGRSQRGARRRIRGAVAGRAR